MTRLAAIDPERLEGELRAQYESATAQGRMLLTPTAHAPDLMGALHDFADVLARRGTLPPRLVEMIRLRVAFHNQCRSCMAVRYESALADGLTEDLVCSLEQPYEAPDLTDAEKAALRFADLFATNHLAIDDALIEQLREHFSEQEIVELCMHCAYCVGYGRMAATYRIIEELPKSFQDTDRKIAPWEQGHTEKMTIKA
jgi:AhpD family alkylhydroperoxidase